MYFNTRRDFSFTEKLDEKKNRKQTLYVLALLISYSKNSENDTSLSLKISEENPHRTPQNRIDSFTSLKLGLYTTVYSNVIFVQAYTFTINLHIMFKHTQVML